ncbi:oxidation resistance protein 1-like [Uloborus diversus]|uniref:oxidation resistance protein 1-like n=1 Tax=Uloborus diversus TaxID=327109 RepID=UPI0024094F73|nr:oxidation resistance protein 1-like [Uloborus diversus]
MSTPTRQRSLRERLQSASRGIGISWQGKKSKSYHSKESLAEAQSSDGDSEPQNKEPIQTGAGQNNRIRDPNEISEGRSTENALSQDEGNEKKALGRTLTQPQGTEQYKVAASDTLVGIAARFDTTPSELAKLNRLSARMVFPGQVLFVPEKKNHGNEASESQESTDTLLPPQSMERRPSVTDALRIPYRRLSERAHRFLKVKARHFTDGRGVVAGVLIITPNAVMFDPNVSDPLVIEHGVESYGVIAPLDMLMRSAIYFDIAHMKVQHAEQGPRPQADVYYGKMTEEASQWEDQGSSSLQEQAPAIEVAPAAEDVVPKTAESASENAKVPEAETEAKCDPILQSHPPSEGNPISQIHPVLETQSSETSDKGQDVVATSVDSVDSFDAEVSDAFSASEIPAESSGPSESRRERMLKRLSYPMESITSISRILTSSPKSFVDFSGSLFSGRGGSEDEPPLREEQEREDVVGYQNLVEEKPEIFETLDKLLSQKKPGEEVEGPPLYLCLRMGIPKDRKPQASPVLSYGKKRAKSEYWFSIPHSRVEDLYSFLQQWIPHLYGDVDDVDPDAAGFLPIDDSLPEEEENEATEGLEESEERSEGKEAPRSFLQLVEEHFGFKTISPGDWEVLSLGEMEKIDYTELELPMPDLLSPSEILTEDHIKELYTLLPARAVGYPWTRIFSTSHDGFHLKTLYRKMSGFDSPVLIAIQDTKGAVFGTLLSIPLRPSDCFYGTGESFLYTFHPNFHVFRWTGNNDYIVKGSLDSVSIGASGGRFGLWLDGDLDRGRSVPCDTFDNEPLASEEDFVIKTLEAWGFA